MTAPPPVPPAESTRPGDHHVTDLLSAYLDDELTPAELVQVEALLETDAGVRQELDGLAQTRALVRSLPQVEPPKALPYVGRSPEPLVTPRKKTLPLVATAAFSIAAVWLLVIALTGTTGARVAPDVEALSLRHLSATEQPLDGGYALMDPGAISMPGFAPASIGHDMNRDGVYQKQSLVHVMFTDSVHAVSVFYQPGVVDWDAMPGGGEMMEMDGAKAWHGSSKMGNVLITEKQGQVVTIIADADMADDMVFSIPALLA